MSTVYKIEKLIAELGEEDYYNENVIDERLSLTAETTPTEDLLPSHYKTLREMIDFIKSHKKICEINASIDNSLHKGSSNIIKKLQKEIEELKEENKQILHHDSEIKRECLKTIKETDMTLDYWNKTHKKEIEELKEENKRIKDYNKKYSDFEKRREVVMEIINKNK